MKEKNNGKCFWIRCNKKATWYLENADRRVRDTHKNPYIIIQSNTKAHKITWPGDKK